MISSKRLREIVNGKLVDHTIDTPFEDLSEEIFGEGNAFSSTEVRKRLYGMKRMMEVEDAEQQEGSGDSTATPPKFLFDELDARKRHASFRPKRSSG